MWFASGDCLVHFNACGASKRGPSLRIPSSAVIDLHCPYLTSQCLRARRISDATSLNWTSIASNEEPEVEAVHTDSGYDSDVASATGEGSSNSRVIFELFIPAPPALTTAQSFNYHVVTRNFLAFAVGRPLVGEDRSLALIGLWARMREWKPRSENGTLLDNFVQYCQGQGYFDFADNAEHALASLKFAEHARMRNLWIDAFVHCVGMHSRLDLSMEWMGVTESTVALLTSAALEMDTQISRTSRATGNFLEEQLGPENLGLSRPARDHLDRFRSFLHAFYVTRFGYFPPWKEQRWNKLLWSQMHDDFQSLYEHLADTESSYELNGRQGITGGICVKQNLRAFDERHGHAPLPHLLPLLPETPVKTCPKAFKTGLKLGRTNSSDDARRSQAQAMQSATNRDLGFDSRALVQEYQLFERQKLGEKLSLSEARKVRWILIYGVLQMLRGMLKMPREVRDVKTPSYPLCTPTVGCPPWEEEQDEASPTAGSDMSNCLAVPDTLYTLEGRVSTSSRISIHPDCEADSAAQYFSMSRSTSGTDLRAFLPSVRPVLSGAARRSSIRESVHLSVNALSRSVVGSLSWKSSGRPSRRPSQELKVSTRTKPVAEDASGDEPIAPSMLSEAEASSPGAPHPTNSLAEFHFNFSSVEAVEPFSLGQPQSDRQSHAPTTPSPPRASSFPVISRRSTSPLPSSPGATMDSTCPDLSSSPCHSRHASDSSALFIATPYAPARARHPSTAPSPLVAGYYRPTQAADMAEEASRVRRRSRTLDRLSRLGGFAMVGA